MEIDDTIAIISSESLNQEVPDSIDLQLQKRLAKLILDTKYESKMSQSSLTQVISIIVSLRPLLASLANPHAECRMQH